ncbi:MAG TPA: hypothetical protein VK609_17430, partial [Mucilaginibacter sp.]|nr:hypothetical protein [Mucilaginibacter sp.]
HDADHTLGQKDLLNYFGDERMDSLLLQKAVDFVTYRGDKTGEYFIRNHDGEAIIKYMEDQYAYHPLSADPLGIGHTIANGHREALEVTTESNYPDALFQIVQLFKSRRAGDLVVSANNGFDLRDFWEFPEHKGSHGSLSREHMQVPLIYNQKGWASHSVRTADLFPTILKWLNKAPVSCEGDALLPHYKPVNQSYVCY